MLHEDERERGAPAAASGEVADGRDSPLRQIWPVAVVVWANRRTWVPAPLDGSTGSTV